MGYQRRVPYGHLLYGASTNEDAKKIIRKDSNMLEKVRLLLTEWAANYLGVLKDVKRSYAFKFYKQTLETMGSVMHLGMDTL